MKAALMLTLGRIVICPLFLIIYLYYPSWGISFKWMPISLLAILTLSEISDIFDGIVARRSNQVTELGKILDPMADSIVRLSILLVFTQGIVQLPLLLVLVFVWRDAMISTLRTLCALRGTALAARASGKIKAVLQAAAIFFILTLMAIHSLDLISLPLLRSLSLQATALTALYTLLSGIEYIWAHRTSIKYALC